jgi:BlaI family penicillinase repressor
MKNTPRISEAEWAVMTVLWEAAPRTANEIVDALADQRDWSPRTVKTLLNRLVGKGVLGYKQQGRRYLYTPKVRRGECVGQESRTFMQRFFGGKAAAMLVHLVDDVELSDEEIDQIRAILRKKREA